MTDPVTRLNAALEGRYAIERELGEGGMATVYLADGSEQSGGPAGGGAVSAFNEVYLVTNWFEELRQRMGN